MRHIQSLEAGQTLQMVSTMCRHWEMRQSLSQLIVMETIVLRSGTAGARPEAMAIQTNTRVRGLLHRQAEMFNKEKENRGHHMTFQLYCIAGSTNWS